MNCNCIYCSSVGSNPWLWKVGPFNSIAWFEIPKNGSVSIKTKYELLWSWRDRTKQQPLTSFDQTISEVYYIWRDPVERFASLFAHYFVRGEKRTLYGNSFLQRLNYDGSKLGLKEKIEICISNIDKFTSKEERHHWFPQHEFLDFRYKLHKLTFENLNESPLGPLNVENATKRPNIVMPALEKYVDDIKSIYAEDYNL